MNDGGGATRPPCCPHCGDPLSERPPSYLSLYRCKCGFIYAVDAPPPGQKRVIAIYRSMYQRTDAIEVERQ